MLEKVKIINGRIDSNNWQIWFKDHTQEINAFFNNITVINKNIMNSSKILNLSSILEMFTLFRCYDNGVRIEQYIFQWEINIIFILLIIQPFLLLFHITYIKYDLCLYWNDMIRNSFILQKEANHIKLFYLLLFSIYLFLSTINITIIEQIVLNDIIQHDQYMMINSCFFSEVLSLLFEDVFKSLLV